jgi:cytoskeletal protein CcmA (bactofilin family)
MSEVFGWSPIDDSNNLTPPDGWPEGMQPSGVNNVGRMMMGAIKRAHDLVMGSIGDRVLKTGDTMTGPLIATQLTSTGNINATLDFGGRSLYLSGLANVGGAVSAGSLAASGDLGVGGNATINGTLGVVGGAAVGGTINAASLTTSGAINAASFSVSGTINAGNITTSTLSASTNVSVADTITAANYQINTAPFATRGTDVAGTGNFIYDGAGGTAIGMYGTNGSYYRCDNAHAFTNRAATLNICRFQATDGNCVNASGLWNVVSDGAVKENVAPYRAGLAEVLQLEPVSYRYTDDAPFGADGQLRYGLVAQDVEPVLPEMIRHAELSRPGSDESADYLTMAPGHLVFVLTNAVKELAAQNAQLSARLATLEGDRHV